ncbi:MAG: zf-HC2 domain-containing protein [Planctomycetes bacterium]|nr:zf-HC2 domain-containing protein [Planctomycetota bacterium]
MNCKEVTEHLGAFVDGELPSALRDDLDAHLKTCSSCRANLDTLREITTELAMPAKVAVPEALWPVIERRLDHELPTSLQAKAPRSPQTHGPSSEIYKPTGRRVWLRRLPLAIAAVVVAVLGLGLLGPAWTGSTAKASTIDFSVLLDALPLDARKAFRKFLVLYDAKEVSPVEARRYAPELNFAVPEGLPGGFELQAVYQLKFGKHPGVAAVYERDGDFLGTVFHRPVIKESFGPHRDYPCVVGRHEGHKVSVGQWKLIHLMEPTTCHCVLSRLDERTELPEIMAILAPQPSVSGALRHNH